MPEQSFETRLAGQLQAYAQGGVRLVDRYAIAEATIATGSARGIGARLAGLAPAMRLAPRVALMLFVLLALAVALVVAARQLQSQVSPGRLAYIRDGDVFVAQSDGSDAIRVLDDPVVDFEHVTTLPGSDQLAVDGNGILAILDVATGERRRIGQTQGHVTWDDHGRFAYLDLSQDEPAIAMGDPSTSSGLRRLTPDGPVSDVLALSPDGRWLATILDGTVYRIDTSTGATTRIGSLGQGDISVSERSLAWSPDADQLVIATQGYGACVVDGGCTPGDHALLILDVDGGGLRPLTGPEAGEPSTDDCCANLGSDLMPRWSPDGQWIAFRASPGLSIVRPDGTDRRNLVTRPVGWFAWAPDSSGLEFVANERLDDAAGELSWMSLTDDGPRSLGLPHVRGLALSPILPDDGATPRRVVAASAAPVLDGGTTKVVEAAGGPPVDPSDAWRGLVFRSGGEEGCQSVWAVDFDDPTARRSAPDGCYQKVSVSPDGRHVAVGGLPQRADGSFDTAYEGQVSLVDLGTGVTNVVREARYGDDVGLGPTVRLLRWSPGGRWLAWDIGGFTSIISGDGSTARLFSSGWPEWSLDDAHVALETNDGELLVGTGDGADLRLVGPSAAIGTWSGGGGRYAFSRGGDAWLANVDGSDLRDLTEFEFGGTSGLALSPDGETLAVVQQGRVLWLIESDGSRRRIDLEPDASLEFVDLEWSPDGSLLGVTSYASAEQQAGTLYLVSRAGSPTVVVRDARAPVWSLDSRYVAFLSGESDRTRIDAANADGSGRRPMTDASVHPDGQIAWVPKP